MTLNPFIFREYDIRGKVNEDFTPDIVECLGKGFGTFLRRNGGREIALSGDIRLSTPNLLKHFKNGVLSSGIDVIKLGLLPTPVNYFSMFKLGVAGAVQITGSHNPPEFNGFKLSMFKKPVYGKEIQKIRELIENNDFEVGAGSEASYNLRPEYFKMIKSKIVIDRPIRIVMDCANAAGCLIAPKLMRELGIEIKELYCEVDGTFPNHHPDPTVESNLKDIVSEIKSGDYDMGIAFDGDADRIGVIDNTGEIIWADQLMTIFLPEIIKNSDEILFDVKCSQALEDMIIKYGGRPVMWNTGHSLIKQKMVELNCKFGGEMSGHIFFADDYYGYDDALYVAARLAQTISRSEKSLSELRKEIPKYYSTPEMRLDCGTDKEKFEISKKATKYFSSNFECNTIDGVRIKFEDGWGLVRASNTQPVIVCRFEARTEERMIEIRQMILDKLNSFGRIITPIDK